MVDITELGDDDYDSYFNDLPTDENVTQVVEEPEAEFRTLHIIERNDTLTSIALKYGCTACEIRVLNGFVHDDMGMNVIKSWLISYRFVRKKYSDDSCSLKVKPRRM
jgi:hypothetical protein